MVMSALGFALMAMFVRLCDDLGGPVSSFQKSFFRNLIAVAVALIVFLRSRSADAARPVFPRGRAWLPLVTRSVLGTVGIFANFYALSHVPIAVGQTLNKTAPFFTVAFTWLWLGERATLRQVLVLVFAFVGVLLMVKPGFAGADGFPLAMGLLGGVAAGGAYACLRNLRTHRIDPAFIILFFSAFSCLASLPWLLVGFDPMTGRQVLALLGAGVGAALGQFGITLAYGYAAPRDIAVYDYSNILFTALLGFLFFGQVPDGLSVAGMAVIVLAALRLGRQ